MQTLEQFQKNLELEVSKLGLDPNFVNNPAYKTIIDEINSMLKSMNISNPSQISVMAEQGKISFQCENYGNNYSFQISSTDPSQVRCLVVTEVKPYTSNGMDIREKKINEDIATINLQSGYIEEFANYALVQETKELGKEAEVKVFPSAEVRHYTPDGIMIDRTEKSYADEKGYVGFDDRDCISVALLTCHQAFTHGGPNSPQPFCTRSFERKCVDTARYREVDGRSGISYAWERRLDTSRSDGLQNMRVLPEQPKDTYYIPSLSLEEIQKITKHSDPRVQEALRKMAIGRENYSYDSRLDPHFVYEETKSKTI